MPYIHTNDIKLHYIESGEGDPLLFLHGNSESHEIFLPLIKVLSQHYHCYALDSRNHGQSQQAGDYHYQSMMEDTVAFIQAMHIAPAHVIGFSDGSIITLLMAMQHPELLRKIILLGPNLTPDDLTDASTRYIQRLHRQNPNPLYQMMLTEPSIALNDLHTIQAPTLIMGGDQDVYKAGTFEKIHEHIPNATLKILSNHNHSSYIVNNDLIHPTVIQFLQ